jgi:hypothetical protein
VRATRCGRCGATLEENAWAGLELVDHLSPGHVRAIVTHWPDEAGIEVRRCRCGGAVARKVAEA